jgi:hypothetical protein
VPIASDVVMVLRSKLLLEVICLCVSRRPKFAQVSGGLPTNNGFGGVGNKNTGLDSTRLCGVDDPGPKTCVD